MTLLFYVAYVLIVLLGIHDFIRARRGLRTGVVEGLMIGFWGKRYSRQSEPDEFWINVWAGFFFAVLGGIALLWGILVTVMAIGDSIGLDPL
jgi:peptidoglycan/LPS O-acetylase OafA/YrhL